MFPEYDPVCTPCPTILRSTDSCLYTVPQVAKKQLYEFNSDIQLAATSMGHVVLRARLANLIQVQKISLDLSFVATTMWAFLLLPPLLLTSVLPLLCAILLVFAALSCCPLPSQPYRGDHKQSHGQIWRDQGWDPILHVTETLISIRFECNTSFLFFQDILSATNAFCLLQMLRLWGLSDCSYIQLQLAEDTNILSHGLLNVLQAETLKLWNVAVHTVITIKLHSFVREVGRLSRWFDSFIERMFQGTSMQRCQHQGMRTGVQFGKNVVFLSQRRSLRSSADRFGAHAHYKDAGPSERAPDYSTIDRQPHNRLITQTFRSKMISHLGVDSKMQGWGFSSISYSHMHLSLLPNASRADLIGQEEKEAPRLSMKQLRNIAECGV